jgi:hypothetical protein
MKKYYALIYTLVFGAFAFWVWTFNASGPPAGHTGSPGDNGNSCRNCHSVTNNFNPSVTLTHNVPNTGYVPGTTYQFTLNVQSSSNKHGFQITAENSSGQKAGTFASTDNNTQTVGSNQYIEHTFAGTSQTSWNFNWTAPSQGTGDVTFYIAVNATNANNATTGDTPVFSNISISENSTAIAESVIDGISLYPNPVAGMLYIDNQTENKIDFLQLFDLSGKEILNVSHPANEIDLSAVPSGRYIVRIKSGYLHGNYQILKK